MISATVFKALIIAILICILMSLVGSGIYMVKDKGQSRRPVIFLTIRIVLSISLFILLFIGLAFDLINPHSGPDTITEQAPVSTPVEQP
jgi:hypothetical protein